MNKDFRILCTGNPNDVGLAKSIKSLYPETTFLSRSSGYDLFEFTCDTEIKFREQLKLHNVFINYSWVTYGVQQKLLQITAEEWIKGHVINIGSTNEDHNVLARLEPEYTEDKLKLRSLSLQLNNEHFKTTHVVVGGFQATSVGSMPNMDPINIANAIKWIIEQEFEIPIIGIQKSSDYIRNWIRQQENKL